MGNKLTLSLGDTRLPIDVSKKHGLLRNQLAYLLATLIYRAKWTD